MIHIYVFAGQKYKHMIENVLLKTKPKTLPEIKIEPLEHSGDVDPGQTQQDSFKELMVVRQEKMLSILKKHEGDSVLFLDSDTIILKDFYEDLKSRLKDNDILHQGGGIVAFNSNSSTISLWEKFVDSLRATPPELREDGFPEFEFQNCANSIPNSSILPSEYGYVKKGAFIYHAMNGGISIVEKYCSLFTAKKIIDHLNSTKKNEINQFTVDDEELTNHNLCEHPLVHAIGFYLLPKYEPNTNVDDYVKNKIRPSLSKRLQLEYMKEIKNKLTCIDFLEKENILHAKKFILNSGHEEAKNFELFFGFSRSWAYDASKIYTGQYDIKEFKKQTFFSLENKKNYVTVLVHELLDDNGELQSVYDDEGNYAGVATASIVKDVVLS